MPTMRVTVAVVVERRRSRSTWIDHVWAPVAVLPDIPEAAPWTSLGGDANAERFYAGIAAMELHTTETANYRDNLASGAPRIWIVLRPRDESPPLDVLCVTPDPAEGEAFTETGTELVDAVPMPAAIAALLAAFVADHHVERAFHKRRRDRADPEALATRAPRREGSSEGGDES
jgi:hypothetical protein